MPYLRLIAGLIVGQCMDLAVHCRYNKSSDSAASSSISIVCHALSFFSAASNCLYIYNLHVYKSILHSRGVNDLAAYFR